MSNPLTVRRRPSYAQPEFILRMCDKCNKPIEKTMPMSSTDELKGMQFYVHTACLPTWKYHPSENED